MNRTTGSLNLSIRRETRTFKARVVSVALLMAVAMGARAAAADEPLRIVVGKTGLTSLTYRGTEYCDPSGRGVAGFSGEPSRIQDSARNPDAFPTTPTSVDLQGSTLTLGYPWGRLQIEYTVQGADLDVRATLTNTSERAIGFWKANLLQLNDRLRFDATGQNMHWDYQRARFGGAQPYSHWGFADPHVYWWNDGGTKILFVDLDCKWSTGVHRLQTENGDRWVAAVSSASAPESNQDVVPPGASDSAHVAIRFRAVSDPVLEVAADGYGAWGRANPRRLRWTDRRPIGTLFVAEAAKGWPKNPNGWFNDPGLDVTTDKGRGVFAERLLDLVDRCIKILKDTDAQGVIWWDVEGARNPHPITYIGDPRVLDPKHPQHDRYAPEMNTPVTFQGKTMPVVDACFANFREAGLKVGLTIRPQALTWNGNAPQQLPNPKPNDETLPKVEYARERWGCRLFYVDSVEDWFACWWYDSVTAKYDDVLMLPEWARTRTFVNAAPFSYTRFTGWQRGTPATVKACWPDAFSCMANVDYSDPAAREGALHAVQQGDVLLFNCWYEHADVQAVKLIYALAGARHAPVAADVAETGMGNLPTEVTLRATDEDGDRLHYRIIESPQHGSLTKLKPEAGTVVYQPQANFLGEDSFTFAARDPSGCDSNRGTVRIRVQDHDAPAKPADDIEKLLELPAP
jgi:hypothetical protein